MFGFLKKAEEKVIIGSPVKGEVVLIQAVSDPTFGEEILGKGVAIKPTEGKFYAPVDGKVALVFDTLHAINIISEDGGAEILIHVGLDTVSLKGQYFNAHVKTGDTVKQGDLLLSVDLEQIKAAGYDVITPMVICNTDDFAEVMAVSGKLVEPREAVLTLTKK